MNKTLQVFIIFNIILSIPLWVGYVISSYNSEIFLALIVVWYLKAFLLPVGHYITNKLIIISSYLYLIVVFLGIFSYFDHNQYWSAFFNLKSIVGALILFIQYQYILATMGYAKADKNDESKNA